MSYSDIAKHTFSSVWDNEASLIVEKRTKLMEPFLNEYDVVTQCAKKLGDFMWRHSLDDTKVVGDVMTMNTTTMRNNEDADTIEWMKKHMNNILDVVYSHPFEYVCLDKSMTLEENFKQWKHNEYVINDSISVINMFILADFDVVYM